MSDRKVIDVEVKGKKVPFCLWFSKYEHIYGVGRDGHRMQNPVLHETL